MNFDDLKLDNQLCHKFYVLSNRITRRYRPLLKEIGLTYPQYLILMALWEKDQLNACDVVCKTKIDPGSLTLILDKLKKKDLINLESCSEDKRKKIITLTEKGEELKERAIEIPKKLSCELGDFSQEDFQKLSELIDKFSCSLPQEK